MRLWRVFLLVWLLIFPVFSSAANVARVNIVWTTPAEDTLGALKKLIAEFNAKQSAIFVKHRVLSWASDDCRNYYIDAFMSGDDSFDVLSGDIIWTSEFASSGWIEPLTDLFSTKEQTHFLPGTIKGCSYDNNIWAVPWFTDSGVLFYRKDLIKYPPKTWVELIEAAKDNIKKGRVKYGYVFQGNQYEGLVCNGLEFIFNNGGDVLEGSNVVIKSNQALEGLQLFLEVIKISPEDVINFQEEDSRLAFQDGQILFMRNWPYNWNLLNQRNSPVKGKVGVAALPIGPSGKTSGGCLGGWNLMINRNSKKKQAAWKFIQYITGENGQKINSIVGGRLPTRIKVYSNPEVLKINPYYPEFFDAFSRSKPRPVSPYYPAISESMQVNFYQAINGKINAKTAINNIDSEIRKIMSQKKF